MEPFPCHLSLPFKIVQALSLQCQSLVAMVKCFAALWVATLLVSVGAHDPQDPAHHAKTQSWTEAANEKLSTFATNAKHKVKETVGEEVIANSERAATTHDESQSYLDMAKEKFNAVTKGALETTKQIKDAASSDAEWAGSQPTAGQDEVVDTAAEAATVAGSKAKVGKDLAAATASGSIDVNIDAADSIKRTGRDATLKVSEIAQEAMDTTHKTAESATIGTTKDNLVGASNKVKEGTGYVKKATGDATSKASETAQSTKDTAYESAGSGVKTMKDTILRASDKAQEGASYVKKKASDATSKAGYVKDSAVESAKSATEETKDIAAAATGKSPDAYKASKDKLRESYDTASAATKSSTAKAGLETATDGAVEVQDAVGTAHEEL